MCQVRQVSSTCTGVLEMESLDSAGRIWFPHPSWAVTLKIHLGVSPSLAGINNEPPGKEAPSKLVLLQPMPATRLLCLAPGAMLS